MRPIKPSSNIVPTTREDDKRNNRLIQMRARQQALRQKRADAAADLANLQTIVSDPSFRTHKLTNRQMKRIMDLVPYKVTGDRLMDLREFIRQGPLKDESSIINMEQMLLKISKKLVGCYRLFLGLENETPIPNNSLCYIHVYGPTFLSPYVNHLKVVAEGKSVPREWLEFGYLPPNTMNVLESLAFILKNLDMNRTNLDLFMLLVGKNIRATPYGPVFSQETLAAAIETSYNPKLDADFFLDSLGTEFCLLTERSAVVKVPWGQKTPV